MRSPSSKEYKPQLLMDNSITKIFLLIDGVNQIVKAINTGTWNSIKLSKPLKDGMITKLDKINIWE